MNFGSTSDLITAIATVVYTVGTFLLWKTTKKNTDLLAEQAKQLQEQATKTASFNRVLVDNAITDAHRELWSLVLGNPKLVQLLCSKEEPEGDDVVLAEWLGSMFVNHCARIFLAHHEKIYNTNDIDSFARDARSLFAYPLIRWRWKSVAKYHSADFKNFVDKMIEA